MEDKVLGAIMGAVVGDAMGLPFEFKERSQIKKRHVGKSRDLGRHNMPLGTCSDDSSMIFCTMDSMLGGYDLKDIGDTFCKWKYESYWTPTGILFDIGGTTANGIRRISFFGKYDGVDGENHCGNGSLMRIMPILFYIKDNREDRFKIIKEVSSLTHSHIRCIIACSIYMEICLNILDGHKKEDAYLKMRDVIIKEYEQYPEELNNFKSILYDDIRDVEAKDLSGSGYVISTLESSLNSFLSSRNYKQAIINSIIIGEDTDTIASITGGLAGLYYGYNKIPKKWMKKIVRKDDVLKLIKDFADIYS